MTDLGTEFGVEVAGDGETTSHVFRGTVSLQAANVDPTVAIAPRVLRENESARVGIDKDANGNRRLVVTAVAAAPTAFVQGIPKPTIKNLDLVDIVAGGDGFSGRRDRGIDSLSGMPTNDWGKDYTSEAEYPVGDGQYHRCEGLPFVDGVFVPNGNAGPMQTDSAGHTFGGFPPTSGQTPGYVWATGQNPPDSRYQVVATLGGVNYASPGHGALLLQSNKAVTFNLDAIRQANPGYKVLRFRTIGDNSEPMPVKGEPVSADLWVLVDGQMRFRRREINGCNGAFPVTVPILENDRFLTLASTDSENGVVWDWITFGDPRLELMPK